MADEKQDVMVPKSALAWLFGEGPDANGHWFGDGADVGKRRGAFWWRTQFRNMINTASPAPAVDWEKVGPDTVEHRDGEEGSTIGWHVEWSKNDFVYCGEASDSELDAHEEEAVELDGARSGFFLFVKDSDEPGMGRLIGKAANAESAFEIISAFRDARAYRAALASAGAGE